MKNIHQTKVINYGHRKKMEYRILKRYFENKATKEEIGLVTKWLEEKYVGSKGEKYLRLLWEEFNSETTESNINFEVLLDKIHHTIQLRSDKQKKLRKISSIHKPQISYPSFLRNLSRIAAILLVPLMSYITWEIVSQKMWVNKQPEVVYNEIKTPLGAQSRFELPDGTKGILNNGSVLKYPVKFTGKTREVELMGEAYFDVKRAPQRPFIINTAGLDVKVLGTILNVYSYPNEDYQEITLVSGSVELVKRSKEQEVTIAKMKPKQHVVYNFGTEKNKIDKKLKKERLLIVNSKDQIDMIDNQLKSGKQVLLSTSEGDLKMEYVKTEQYTGWKEGKLILKNDPMPVLLKRMERWYSVKFNIKDKRINDYTYWATFEEENLVQVLKLLSLTGPIKFKMLPREKMEDGSFKPQEIDVDIKL